MQVQTFSREEFVTRRWHYRKGDHVTFLGTTGCGKTTLAYQLMQATARPTLPAVVLCMKPRDDTVRTLSKGARYRTVRTWPPVPSPWHPRRPAGYVLWPRHTFDPEHDDYVMWQQFRTAILDSYKKGDRILFGDEVYGLSQELGLQKELVTVWSRGRSMGTGLWAASQRPAQIPLWAYSQAEHLFLWNEPDRRARVRFAEIGGVDPDLVMSTVADLGRHQVLYIRRAGPALCVVDR